MPTNIRVDTRRTPEKPQTQALQNGATGLDTRRRRSRQCADRRRCEHRTHSCKNTRRTKATSATKATTTQRPTRHQLRSAWGPGGGGGFAAFSLSRPRHSLTHYNYLAPTPPACQRGSRLLLHVPMSRVASVTRRLAQKNRPRDWGTTTGRSRVSRCVRANRYSATSSTGASLDGCWGTTAVSRTAEHLCALAGRSRASRFHARSLPWCKTVVSRAATVTHMCALHTASRAPMHLLALTGRARPHRTRALRQFSARCPQVRRQLEQTARRERLSIAQCVVHGRAWRNRLARELDGESTTLGALPLTGPGAPEQLTAAPFLLQAKGFLLLKSSTPHTLHSRQSLLVFRGPEPRIAHTVQRTPLGYNKAAEPALLSL